MPASRLPSRPPNVDEDVSRVMAFVNTRTGRGTGSEEERLPTFQALVEWARGAAVISPAAAGRLAAEARRRPAEAGQALERTRVLRETLHAVFAALEAGRPPAAPVLAALQAQLGAAYLAARLVPQDGRLEWGPGPPAGLETIGLELARAAGRLVTSNALARVRACAADDCRWWFIDDTKNRSRRWCDMKTCGNREKLRRYRARSAS